MPRLSPLPADQSGTVRAARPPIRKTALTLLIVTVLALAAAALFGDQPVQGQTTTTLVKNKGQGISTFQSRQLNRVHEAWGQVFTTGSDATEYRPDSIGIRFATIHASSSPATELTVTLNDADVIGSAQAPNDDDMPPPPVRGFLAVDESQDAIALNWWSERGADEYELEFRKRGDSV